MEVLCFSWSVWHTPTVTQTFRSPSADPEQSCSTMVSTTYSTTLVTAFHHFKCHGWVRKGEGLYISCWTEDLDIFKLYSTVHKDDIEDDNYKKIRLKRQETALFIFLTEETLQFLSLWNILIYFLHGEYLHVTFRNKHCFGEFPFNQGLYRTTWSMRSRPCPWL